MNNSNIMALGPNKNKKSLFPEEKACGDAPSHFKKFCDNQSFLKRSSVTGTHANNPLAVHRADLFSAYIPLAGLLAWACTHAVTAAVPRGIRTRLPYSPDTSGHLWVFIFTALGTNIMIYANRNDPFV